LYNPKSKRILVSRDVVFEEGMAWEWSAEFGENSKFVVDESVGVVAQPWTGVVVGGGNLQDHSDENSGGAGGPFDGVQTTGEVVESIQQGTETQTDTVQGQTTDAESAPAQNADLDQGHMDMGDSSGYDEEPLRFRSPNEVYQDSVEVELTFDTEVDALLAAMEEPNCYKEAAGDRDLVLAMKSEIQSINKNKTWELVNLPAGHKPIGLKWVFKLKRNADGEVVKHKARLVAKGYVQK